MLWSPAITRCRCRAFGKERLNTSDVATRAVVKVGGYGIGVALMEDRRFRKWMRFWTAADETYISQSLKNDCILTSTTYLTFDVSWRYYRRSREDLNMVQCQQFYKNVQSTRIEPPTMILQQEYQTKCESPKKTHRARPWVAKEDLPRRVKAKEKSMQRDEVPLLPHTSSKKQYLNDYNYYLGSAKDASDYETTSEFLISHVKKCWFVVWKWHRNGSETIKTNWRNSIESLVWRWGEHWIYRRCLCYGILSI